MGRLQGREFRLKGVPANKDSFKVAVGCAVLVVPFTAIFVFAAFEVWQAACTGIVQGFGGRGHPAQLVPVSHSVDFWALTGVWTLLVITGLVMAAWLALMAIAGFDAARRYQEKHPKPGER